ncbi:MAG: transcription antitermination factor NusB [Clostridia bacterium]|nr:transcription antitermination factor NusB [Clostridia bacterium]
MGRREAREYAFQLLYQLEIQKEDPIRQIGEFIDLWGIQDADAEYVRCLAEGVSQSKAELDGIYAGYLKRWTTERLPRIDITILRIAVFEIVHVDSVPPSVSVNEAVLLARKYSSEEARSYINAVLGKVVAAHCPGVEVPGVPLEEGRGDPHDHG